MTSKKLNQFTHHGYSQSGASQKFIMHMNIETGGGLRLFTDIAPYVTAAVSLPYGSYRHEDIQVEGNRIFGRDPEKIKDAVRRLFDMYRRLMVEQQRHAVIIIHLDTRIPGRRSSNHDFSFIDHQMVIALNFERYWRSGSSLYAYNEADLSEMRSSGTSHRMDNGKEIPYTPEAWAALHSIRDGMVRGIDKLRGFIDADNLPQLLTSGNLNLLGVDS